MASNNEGSRMMYNPETGKTGAVPFSMVEQAVKDGLELTTPMINPQTGGQGWIPMSQASQAEKDGLQHSDVPFVESPYEKMIASQKSKKAIEDESLSDKFQRTFLSGGGNDIRNMAAATIGAAPLAVGSAIASGVTRYGPAVVEGTKDALASGRQLFQQVANSGVGKMLASGASGVYNAGKAVTTGLGKLGTGLAAGTYLDDKLNEGRIRQSLKDLF